MNLKLDDIMDTLKDMQKPCHEGTDGAVHERIIRLEEVVRKVVNDVADVQSKLSDIREDIIENRQYTTSKYHELLTGQNDNREYSTVKYHELKAEANGYVEAANTKHRELKVSYEELKQHVDKNVKISGTSYVRWGRTTCPGNGSEIVYSGYAGGSYYNHNGAAASMLCLPKNPDWATHTDSEENSGFVYGAEYEPSSGRTDKFFGKGLADQDVPCVVCNVKSRSSSIMIPGKTSCHPGWTLEYTGYLMSGYYQHPAARDYYCIDKKPESITGGERNDDGYLLHFVEARCGSLKCPPYVNAWELTCVVCSK